MNKNPRFGGDFLLWFSQDFVNITLLKLNNKMSRRT